MSIKSAFVSAASTITQAVNAMLCVNRQEEVNAILCVNRQEERPTTTRDYRRTATTVECLLVRYPEKENVEKKPSIVVRTVKLVSEGFSCTAKYPRHSIELPQAGLRP